GARQIDLPVPTGGASRLVVSDFPAFLPGGTVGTFTVTALDPDGNVDKNFTGTVAFSSSAGSASLPPASSFTAADQVNLSFTATFNSQGLLPPTAPSAGLTSGGEGGIEVHASGPVVRVPMLDRRGMVYDSGRDLLYFATDPGTVERYSPTAGVLLAPWKVGNNLRGIDLTPD